ncbi:6-phosphogluconolactonase [soil metagenome]
MSSTPTVEVHRTAEELAEAVAARLVTRLVDVQSAGREAHVVLTGGTIARTVHRTLRDSPAVSAVDWRRVHVWWGDERFVPADDPERNEAQAREDLLDALPLQPDHVHPVAASDGAHGDDVDAAAAGYATELARRALPEDHGDVPTFDVLMLGIGPDGHVASLFPEHPALHETRSVVAVRHSPKPPPTRVTMTFPTLARAHEVWFLASGDSKAGAVRNALSGAGQLQVPAAGPRGTERSVWLLDHDAAAALPAQLRHPGSR